MRHTLGRALARATGAGVTRDDIRWAYRTLLGREPESDEAVNEHLGARSVRALVDGFVRTPEFARSAAIRSVGAALPRAHYLSLGTHCFTSAFLRRLGVRTWSGPFDWTFASVPMIAHCIADGFATFLDRSQHEPVPLADRPNGPQVNRVQHRFYRDAFGVQFVFNHHDVHLDDGHAYLARCVARFEAALADALPVVFLIVTHGYDGVVEQITELTAALRARTGRFQMLALAVDHAGVAPDLPETEPVVTSDDLGVYRFRGTSRLGPVAFERPIDEAAVAHLLFDRASRLESLVQPAVD